MPRKRRLQSPTGVYHWITRGINKKELFHHSKDYDYFKGLLAEYKQSYDILIYHYCLMRNHVHMLIYSPSVEATARFSQYVHRRYAYYYCAKYHWSGSIFQRGYRSLVVDKEAYLLECGRYIEANPVKARLLEDPGQYPYSSYKYYSQGQTDILIDTSPAYLALSDSEESRMAVYTEFVTQPNMMDEMAIMQRTLF